MTAATRCIVTFALGTDPDQNTVNVNNRVQLAIASCRRRCSGRASR